MGSSPIRFSGMASGMDTESMVKAMVLRYQEKVDDKKKAQTKLEWKKDAYSAMNTKFYDFYTKTASQSRLQSSFTKKNLVSSNTDKVGVSSTGYAPEGTHTIDKVMQMATSARINTTSIGQIITGKVDPSSEEAVTSNTRLSELGVKEDLTIKVTDGLNAREIVLKASDKLSDVTDKINALQSSDGTHAGLAIRASYDSTAGKFKICSTTGNAQNISIQTSESSKSDLLKNIGLQTSKITKKTKLSELGITSEHVLKVSDNSGSSEIIVKADMTIGELAAEMQQELTSSSVSYDETAAAFFISSRKTGAGQSLNLEVTEGEMGNELLQALGIGSGSKVTKNFKLEGATGNVAEAEKATKTLGELGVNSSSVVVVKFNDGSDKAVTFDSNSTLKEMQDELSKYMPGASVDFTDGKYVISTTDLKIGQNISMEIKADKVLFGGGLSEIWTRDFAIEAESGDLSEDTLLRTLTPNGNASEFKLTVNGTETIEIPLVDSNSVDLNKTVKDLMKELTTKLGGTAEIKDGELKIHATGNISTIGSLSIENVENNSIFIRRDTKWKKYITMETLSGQTNVTEDTNLGLGVGEVLKVTIGNEELTLKGTDKTVGDLKALIPVGTHNIQDVQFESGKLLIKSKGNENVKISVESKDYNFSQYDFSSKNDEGILKQAKAPQLKVEEANKEVVYDFSEINKLLKSGKIDSNNDKLNLKINGDSMTIELTYRDEHNEVKVKDLDRLVQDINVKINEKIDANPDSTWNGTTAEKYGTQVYFHNDDLDKIKDIRIHAQGTVDAYERSFYLNYREPGTYTEKQITPQTTFAELGITEDTKITLNNGSSSTDVLIRSTDTVENIRNIIDAMPEYEFIIDSSTKRAQIIVKNEDKNKLDDASISMSSTQQLFEAYQRNGREYQAQYNASDLDDLILSGTFQDNDVLKIKVDGEEVKISLKNLHNLEELKQELEQELTNHPILSSSGTTVSVDAKKLVFSNKDVAKIQDIEISVQNKNISHLSEEETIIENSFSAQGSNAHFSYNGVDMQSESNMLTVNGMDITIKGETDTPVNISVSTNTDSAYEFIKSFVEAYNTLIKDANTSLHADSAGKLEPLTNEEKESMTDSDVELWEKKIKDSLLRRDSTLSDTLSDMRAVLSSIVEGGTYKSLSSIGITTSAVLKDYGKLEINEEVLKAALANDPEGVTSLFAGGRSAKSAYLESNKDKTAADYEKLSDKEKEVWKKKVQGIGERLYEVLGQRYTKIENMKTSASMFNDTLLEKQISTTKDEYGLLVDQLNDKEDYYYKRLAAMETAMNKLNSQQNYLAQMLGTGSR